MKSEPEGKYKDMEDEFIRFKTFSMINPSLIIEFDFSGKMTYSNEKAKYILKAMELEDAEPFFPKDLIEERSNKDKNEEIEHVHRQLSLRNKIFETEIFISDELEKIQIYAQDITFIKKREEKTRYDELILNSVNDAIIGLDNNTVINYWNKGAQNIYGYTESEAIGKKLIDLLRPKYLPGEREKIFDDMRQYGHIKTTIITRHKNDDEVIVELFSTRAIDLNDNVSAYIVIIHDITERIKVESRLKDSEQLYRAIGELIHYGIWVCDPKGRNIYASDSYLKLVGLTQEEYSESFSAWSKVLHPDDAKRAIAAWDECVKNEGIWDSEDRYKGVDGKWHPILSRGVPVRDEEGKIKFWAGINLDISRLKKSQEDLKESEERFRLIASNTPDHIIVQDTDLRYTAIINPQLGLTEEEMIGKTDFDLVSRTDAEKITAIKREVIRTGISLNTNIPIKDENGTIHYYEGVYVPKRNSTNEINGLIGYFRDVTEQKRKEKEIKTINRVLRAISDSSAAIIHAKDEESYLKEVCRIITDDCGHAMVWIGFANDDEEKTVTPAAYSGFEQGYLDTLKISWDDTQRGRGPTGTAIRTGTIRTCKNMTTDPLFEPWREEAIKRGYASSIALPLIHKDKVLGALTIYSKETDAFADEEIKLLTELARDLSYGIRSIRLRLAHRKAEKDLAIERNNLQMIFDTISVGMIMIDEDYIIRRVNNTLVKWINKAPELIMGQKLGTGLNCIKLLNSPMLCGGLPNCTDCIVHNNIRAIFNNGEKIRNVETEVTIMINEKPHHFWLEISADLIIFENKKYVILTFNNITKRKNAEDQLRKLSRIVEQSPDSIMITDKEGVIEYVNPKFAEISGYNSEDVIGKKPDILKSGKTSKSTYQHLWNTIKKGKDWHGLLQNRKKNGELYWESSVIYAIRDASGNISNFAASKLDITKHKKIEDEIEKQTKILLEQAHMLELSNIFIRDKNDKIISWNSGAEKMYGFTQEEAIGKYSYKLLHTIFPKTIEEIKKEVIENGSWDGELIQIKKNGEKIHVASNWIAYRNTKDEITAFIEVNHDITPTKNIQTQLALALKEKEMLIQEVHHRVKNNLQIISSILNIQSRNLKDKRDQEIIEQSKNQIHAIALVHEKLCRTEDMQSVNFAEYVKELTKNIMQTFARTNIKMDIKITGDILSIEKAIPCGLIIDELMMNSIKHAFTKDHDGTISISFKIIKNTCILIVGDTGPGFPKNFNWKESSSLGLHFVSMLTEQLNGSIELENKKGAQWTITFPQND